MKLNSANDILNNASRYGDWVRRARRRKRLEVLQVGACVCGGAAGGGGATREAITHWYGCGDKRGGVQAPAKSLCCSLPATQ